MAYKSRFTGTKIDELLEIVQNQQTNPGSVIENVTGDQLLEKMTGQQIIDKINSVTGNIVFTKFVDCQGGGGKEGV